MPKNRDNLKHYFDHKRQMQESILEMNKYIGLKQALGGSLIHLAR